MFMAITLIIAPSKTETIYHLPYILFSTLIACEKVYQALVITVRFMIDFNLKLSPVLVNVSVSVTFMHTSLRGLLHSNDPTLLCNG